MSKETAILITLILYKIVLLGMGAYASRKTKDGSDFFLGGRTLGPVVAALSASASSSSAWTLLGVSGMAYATGLSAIWIFPACVGGFMLNWCLLGPGLRRLSERDGSLTVSEVLAGPPGSPKRQLIGRVAAAIVVLSLATYVASQFKGASKTFTEVFQMGRIESILLGAAIVVIYTMMGGFWAVSLTDSLQGFLMMATSLALPIAALIATGGFGGLWEGLQTVDVPGYSSLWKDGGLVVSLGFLFGLLGIGLGYPGQPHVVNRFMALKDEKSMATGRMIAIVWAVIVYSGMLIVGWCGRLLFPDIVDKEVVFLTATTELFPPVVAGIMIAAVLSAVMSTADSQLLVLVSSLTHDLNLDGDTGEGLLKRSRVLIVIVSACSVVAAIYGPDEIFKFVLFAWSAMGAAFGPLLLVNVLKGRVNPNATLIAMLCGFFLSITAYYIPSTKGTAVERVLPWIISFVVAWNGVKVRSADE